MISRQKHIFVYPVNSDAQFIKSIINALALTGNFVFQDRKLFLKRALSKRKDLTVLVNWLEETPYETGLSSIGAFYRCVKAIAMTFMFLLCSKRIVWIRHNITPHDTIHSMLYYRLLCRLLHSVSDKTVYLEQYAQSWFSAKIHNNNSAIAKARSNEHFANHPLYKSDGALRELANEPRHNRDILLGFYGYIKPYKNLHMLLNTWPVSLKLVIKGKCVDPKYETQLLEIIKHRQLNVDFENVHLSDAQYNTMLARTKFVLLPHQDKTIISSGIFYHAISFGCNVLVGNSEFGRQKIKQHNFVYALNELPLTVESIKNSGQAPSTIIQAAVASYGNLQIKQYWQDLF